MSPLAFARRRLADRIRILSRLVPHHSRAGTVAIVTAICAPILVMIVGFVIDFSYASYINQGLARATDAATIGSVSQTAATAAGGYGDVTFLQATGVNYFNANIKQLGLTGVNFSLSVIPDGAGGVVASGAYTYNVPTFFAGVVGINNIPVSGSAMTSARPVSYVNYYILVDTSQSMGIASTAADMTKLYNLVVSNNNGSGGETGCVFGCHVLALGQHVTNEQLAHSNNVVLRVDSAKTAIESIISQAQSIAGATQNIKFGLYTIQEDPTTGLVIRTVASPSTNYSSLQTAAATIDLGDNTSLMTGDSDMPNEFIAFDTLLTLSGVITNGSGASATSPLNYIFIITDGVTDTSGPFCGGTGHCTGPVNPLNCALFKTKSTVGIINTIYSPIYANNNPSVNVLESNYLNLVAPFSSQIKPGLQGCATSSDFYFEASDGPGIITATQSLFQRTQPSSARITQ